MAFDEQRAMHKKRGKPRGSEPGLSEPRCVGPLHDEALIVQLRASTMCAEKCQLLLKIDEVASLLRISAKQVQQLITTRQLASIIFEEQELVPVCELVDLITDYLSTSKRSSL